MGLLDNLSEGKEVKVARQTLERINSKRKLTKNDRRKVKRDEAVISAHSASVRKRLAIAGVVLGTIAGGSALLLGGKSLDDKEKVTVTRETGPSSPEEKLSPEECTERTISKIETGMERFRRKLEPEIRKNIKDERLKQELLKPFATVQANTKNPYKNVEVLLNKYGGHVDNLQSRYFFYGLFERHMPNAPKLAVAAFQTGRRALMIRRNLNPESIPSMLILYHELMHAGDNIALIEANPESFMKWAKENTGSVLNWESKAYASEVEILNLLTHGDIRRAVVSGIDTTSDEFLFRICETNGISLQDPNIQIIKDVLSLAKLYYPSGIVNGLVPKPFYEALINNISVLGDCDKPGGDCDIITADSRIIKVIPGQLASMETEARRYY